ncbi:MAG: HlyD family secretion protein [Acidobacteria bacterium]|nr:HlyD family secretion protein [Acidobacteriota bacterium]
MSQRLESLKTWVRRRRRAALGLGAAAAAVVLLAAFWPRASRAQYFTSEVEQGDIQAIVNATGTINAVTTIQVGSQVSGMVADLFADFNSQVKKGEVIAQIDPAIFRTRVLQAEADLANAEAGVKSLDADLIAAQANLEKSGAALREAELNRQRTLRLFEQGIASLEQRDSVQVAYETAVANQRVAEAQISQTRARLDQQRAQVKQRQAQLEQARLDLEHTIIRAPIDGIVIARSVDRGQTVAASLQAPTLFTIAQDLTKMLVYAKTDESDVGRIRVGALASFKVDSFPYDTFGGRVTQVRMNAYQVQNVVTYDTIIEFDNSERKLLPGMTAYVSIPVATARDVTKIPNGALRFVPDLPEADRTALLRKYNLLGEPPRPEAGQGTVLAQERGPGRRETATQEGSGQPRGSGRGSDRDRARRRERWQSMSEEERARMRAAGMARRAAAAGQEGKVLQGPTQSGPGAEGAYQIVWKLNPDNSLQPVRVKAGLTDFAYTAQLEGTLRPGDKLVIGQTRRQLTGQPFGQPPRRF